MDYSTIPRQEPATGADSEPVAIGIRCAEALSDILSLHEEPRADPLRVQLARYVGEDGPFLGQLVQLVRLGKISEAKVVEACCGPREVTPRPHNPLAYVRASLRESVPEFESLLKTATNGYKSLTCKADGVDLLDSLQGEWIRLPLDTMRNVGPAAQTLGGLLRLTKGETYSAVSRIAESAHVPISTARKHLGRLDKKGWIENAGRRRNPRGRPCRTCTIIVNSKAREAARAYAVLPVWACVKGWNWGERAILAVVMAQLMKLSAAADREERCSPEDPWGNIEILGGADRFRFSLPKLSGLTGLGERTISHAKRKLAERGIIAHSSETREDGGTGTDILMPLADFRVLLP